MKSPRAHGTGGFQKKSAIGGANWQRTYEKHVRQLRVDKVFVYFT
jgi:hypothetical protein